MSVARQAASEHVEPEKSNGHAGSNAKPGVDVVRHNVFRSVKSDQAQRIDSGGVRDRNDYAQEQRMGCRSLRSHQVGCNDRLSVTRLKRVQPAERRSDQCGSNEEPQSPALGGNKVSEGVVRSALLIRFQSQLPRLCGRRGGTRPANCRIRISG